MSSKQASTLKLVSLPGTRFANVDEDRLSQHIFMAGWGDKSFAQLVADGPREGTMSDWVRLVPFVMWAACYVIPEFIQVASKPEVVESLWIPNEDIAGWIVGSFDKMTAEL